MIHHKRSSRLLMLCGSLLACSLAVAVEFSVFGGPVARYYHFDGGQSPVTADQSTYSLYDNEIAVGGSLHMAPIFNLPMNLSFEWISAGEKTLIQKYLDRHHSDLSSAEQWMNHEDVYAFSMNLEDSDRKGFVGFVVEKTRLFVELKSFSPTYDIGAPLNLQTSTTHRTEDLWYLGIQAGWTHPFSDSVACGVVAKALYLPSGISEYANTILKVKTLSEVDLTGYTSLQQAVIAAIFSTLGIIDALNVPLAASIGHDVSSQMMSFNLFVRVSPTWVE